MADQYNLGELTKQMVASRLKSLENAPEVAAEIVKKTIVAGLLGTQHSGQTPRDSVREICHGAISGIMLIDKDLSQSVLCILEKLAEASQETHTSPEDLMTWALEGVAGMAPAMPMQVQAKIRDAINERYMGAGDVFEQLCAAAQKRG